MPVQTNQTGHIYFPDGALVEVSVAGGTYFDLGAINSAVTATLNWDEATVETANAGKLKTRISNMEMSGGFTLINLNPEGVKKLGGGIFTLTNNAGTAVTTGIAVQSLGDVTANKLYTLSPTTTAGVPLKPYAVPTLNKVKAGSTELTVNTDYTVINNDGDFCLSFAAAKSNVTVTYSSVTPVESTVITAGTSTHVMDAYSMRITHYNDPANPLTSAFRRLELFSVNTQSGGFQFNFKGANEDGVEEMPLQFTARLDPTKTDGAQLMAWTISGDAE